MKLTLGSYLFCILIVFVSNVFSQINNDSVKATSSQLKPFIIVVEFGPQYCYRVKTNGSKPLPYQDGRRYEYYGTSDENYNTSNDNPGTGFVVGVSVNMKIHKGLRIKTGLFYEKFSYNAGPIDTLYIYNKSLYSPLEIVKVEHKAKISYDYNFLYMPVEFKYYFKLSNKTYLNIGLGCNFGLNIETTVKRQIPEKNDRIYRYGVLYDSDKGKDWRLQQFTSRAFNLFGDIGINYFPAKNFGISIEPYFQRSFVKYELNTWNYSAGIKLGVLF